MRTALCLVLALLCASGVAAAAQETAGAKPMRLAIAGLVHGHVSGFLKAAQARGDVRIVGMFDSDRALLRKYADRVALPESALFTDLAAMLDRVSPDAVAAFTNTHDHPEVVEAAARRRIHVMMEKPLAVSTDHARRIVRAAEQGAIHVFVNYETTWYPSHGAIWSLIKQKSAAGDIRKMVALATPGRKRSTCNPNSWTGCPTR